MNTTDLRSRPAPLEMSADEFRAVGHRLVDAVAAFLASLPSRPVTRDETPSALRALLPGALPETGSDAGGLLDAAVPLLVEHSLFNGHPRFLGYITSSAAPIGALADLLASAVNPNVGGWQLSPIASEIEGQCVRWVAELLGMPRGTEGLLVSGGNMANFVGFLAARRAGGGADVREKGVGAGGALTFYAASETHTWAEKAADLFGHGAAAFRSVPVLDDLTMDVEALLRMLDEDRREGGRPFLLVGNAGTVSTGAVDPLPRLAEVARAQGLWFHVDGAYGAPAVLCDEAPAALREGLALADSVAVDPHKWLYAPVEAGCTLVRHPGVLRDTFCYSPPYYRFDGEAEDPRTNYFELGPQNSRGFRALKVWLALRQAGREGYRRMIGDDIRLARALDGAVRREPRLEPWTLGLSIATFRYVPEGVVAGTPKGEEYLNHLNEELLHRLKTSGELFVSNAVVRGTFLLRACIVNFRTALADVEAVPGIVVRHGAAVDRELRGR
jgi:glutamate/tyrosine decarboxylase-like PLP-dependent enzyme